MHRRHFIFIALVLFAASVLSTAAAAGSYDSVFSSAQFSTLVEFDKSVIGTYEMRGFTSTADGKYLFGGLLQEDRRVLKIDAATGKVAGEYKDSEPGYGKGLATDDRGFLYVGTANAANDGAVGFAIVEIASMKEVKFVSAEISGKVGVNGVTVAKTGDKYYMYLITNYDTDRLYCYDVTNTSNPVLKTDFGANAGYTDIQALTGTADCDANYLAVDSEGVIYMTAKIASGSKGDTIFKIKADGTGIISKAPLTEPYGITHRDGYLLVSTYNGADSTVYVLNASDLTTVCEIGNMSDASKYSGVAIGGDKIYISDQGFGSGDRILVSGALAFPAAETEAPAETAAADPGADTGAAPADTAAPAAAQTADILSVSVSALAFAAAAFMITRRKK